MGRDFPATVFPAATIAWAQVDDIDLLAPPPTVWVGGELLLVSAVDRDKLAEYGGRHPIIQALISAPAPTRF